MESHEISKVDDNIDREYLNDILTGQIGYGGKGSRTVFVGDKKFNIYSHKGRMDAYVAVCGDRGLEVEYGVLGDFVRGNKYLVRDKGVDVEGGELEEKVGGTDVVKKKGGIGKRMIATALLTTLSVGAMTSAAGAYNSASEPKIGSSTYNIKSGDTMGKIASSYGVAVGDLMKINGNIVTDKNTIFAGQRIYVPASDDEKSSDILKIKADRKKIFVPYVEAVGTSSTGFDALVDGDIPGCDYVNSRVNCNLSDVKAGFSDGTGENLLTADYFAGSGSKIVLRDLAIKNDYSGENVETGECKFRLEGLNYDLPCSSNGAYSGFYFGRSTKSVVDDTPDRVDTKKGLEPDVWNKPGVSGFFKGVWRSIFGVSSEEKSLKKSAQTTTFSSEKLEDWEESSGA